MVCECVTTPQIEIKTHTHILYTQLYQTLYAIFP